MSAPTTITRTLRIDEDVLNVLANSNMVGDALYLPQQLDRKLYVGTNKVLEALGGKWNRHAKAHLFPCDAADAVDNAVLTGTYSRTKQDFGAFYTPLHIGLEVCARAAISPGMKVLEPSAGDGSLARIAANRAGSGNVTCIEIRPEACEQLRICGFETIQTDFLSIMPEPKFDRVVMNPPFARRADIYHISHAHGFLRPGGHLVAIASASVMFRDDALGKGFRDLVRKNWGFIEELPDGSFQESGTMVRTVMITMEAS